LHLHRGQSEEYPANLTAAGRANAPRPLMVLVFLVLFVSCVLPNSAIESCNPCPDGSEPETGAHSLVIDEVNVTFEFSPTRVYPGDPVTFYVNATSFDPTTTIEVTIYYDYELPDGTVNPYSPVSVNVTGTPAYVMTSYTYDHIGNLSDAAGTFFRLRATVTDGTPISPKGGRMYVVDNAAPSLSGIPPAIIGDVDYNLPYNVSYVVHDWDSELVTATWDFGDGTDPVVNETIATPTGSYLQQTHTWAVILEPGRDASESNPYKYYILFNMSVSFVDSVGHVIYSNHTVNITPPDNDEPDSNFTAASLYSSPGYDLEFFANATDPEGDPITWTFVFNNSIEDYLTEVRHTDPTDPMTTVWQNITHAFSSVGTYSVTLFISDALPPYQIGLHNQSQTLKITVSDNRAPGVLANITVFPTIPKINSTLGYAEVKFSIQANDFDGDILYLSWDFGDDEGASNVSLGGIQKYTFNQTHRYAVGGLYNVSVIVDDARGHTVLKYNLVSVQTDNAAPKFVSIDLDMSNGIFAIPGSTVNLTITISDAELDPVTLWVNFGDNSSIVMVNLTEFTSNKTVSSKVTHIYNSTGEYNVTISFTDGMYGKSHNVTVNLTIVVKVPRTSTVRVWNWWDSTSLGLVGLGVCLILLRWYLLGRFRKDLDGKGTTLEEYQIIVKELRAERSAGLKRVNAQAKKDGLGRAQAKKMKADVRNGYRKSRLDLRAGKRVEIEGGS
jgi:hypothetical protein